MTFSLREIGALAASIFEGRFDTRRFDRRIRHIAGSKLIEPSHHEGSYARAARLFEADQACLGALLLWSTEILNFEIETQALIVEAIRDAARKSSPSASPRMGAGSAFDLGRAVEGVARGEEWALRLDIRIHLGGANDAELRKFSAQFMPLEESRPRPGAESLLKSAGKPLFGTVILPLNELFAPFAKA